MAVDMGSELDNQNNQIDRINKKVSLYQCNQALQLQLIIIVWTMNVQTYCGGPSPYYVCVCVCLIRFSGSNKFLLYLVSISYCTVIYISPTPTTICSTIGIATQWCITILFNVQSIWSKNSYYLLISNRLIVSPIYHIWYYLKSIHDLFCIELLEGLTTIAHFLNNLHWNEKPLLADSKLPNIWKTIEFKNSKIEFRFFSYRRIK